MLAMRAIICELILPSICISFNDLRSLRDVKKVMNIEVLQSQMSGFSEFAFAWPKIKVSPNFKELCWLLPRQTRNAVTVEHAYRH